LAFLRGLVARGLAGVQLVISDAHQGLKAAIAAVLHGSGWQRCRVHFMRNALALVPKAAAQLVAATIRTVFAQPDPEMAWPAWRQVADGFRPRYPKLAALLDEAESDVLAYLAFPRDHWRQIWSNNPLERVNREVKRRTDVVGIFPHEAAILRLVGMIVAEQHDEWQVCRRYFSAESLARLAPASLAPASTVAMGITQNPHIPGHIRMSQVRILSALPEFKRIREIRICRTVPSQMSVSRSEAPIPYRQSGSELQEDKKPPGTQPGASRGTG
jgi:putative transposase